MIRSSLMVLKVMIVVFTASLAAEPFCFADKNGNLKCINVSPNLGGNGGAGGGGCGGSSKCGGNNLETDWIDLYVKKHKNEINDTGKFEKILRDYNKKSIQLEISPMPVSK